MPLSPARKLALLLWERMTPERTVALAHALNRTVLLESAGVVAHGEMVIPGLEQMPPRRQTVAVSEEDADDDCYCDDDDLDCDCHDADTLMEADDEAVRLEEAGEKRSVGDKWEGKSGRWFTVSASGRVVPTSNPNKQAKPGKPRPKSDKPTPGGGKPGKAEKPTVEKAHARIKELLTAGQASPEHVKALAGELMGLTVAQLGELKKGLGLKASGPKAELAAKLAERALAAGEKKQGPKPGPKPGGEKAPQPRGTTAPPDDHLARVARAVLARQGTADPRAGLHDLARETGLALPELHAAVEHLRRQGLLTGQAHEGGRGGDREIVAHAIREPGGDLISHVRPDPEGAAELAKLAGASDGKGASSAQASGGARGVIDLYADAITPDFTDKEFGAELSARLAGLSGDELRQAFVAVAGREPLSSEKQKQQREQIAIRTLRRRSSLIRGGEGSFDRNSPDRWERQLAASLRSGEADEAAILASAKKMLSGNNFAGSDVVKAGAAMGLLSDQEAAAWQAKMRGGLFRKRTDKDAAAELLAGRLAAKATERAKRARS